MPVGGYQNNSSSLLRALAPGQYRSYAQMSAQKDQELRLAMAQAEDARVQQQTQQQQIQSQQQMLSKLKALPFEGPDQRRIKDLVLEKQKDAAKRIETEYNGDEQKFIETEGSMWLENAWSDIQSTDLYNTAQRNKEMIAMAKSAIQKGDNLIGRLDNGKYINAEQDLLNYYAGGTPAFSFNGSYTPKSGIYDHFGKLDNPYGSKFDSSSYVKDRDVVSYLQSEKGDKAGLDMYMRQFQGAKVPFKRYSLEDKQLFGVDLANKAAGIAQKKASTSLSYARINKLNRDEKEESIYQNAVPTIAGSAIQTLPYQNIADPNQKISKLGLTLGDISVPGAGGKPGLEFTEISGLTLGTPYSKYSGIKKGAKVEEGVVLGSGKVLDLSKIPNTVINSSSNIFIDQNEYNKATQEDRLPGREFKRATVRINREDAIKAGLVSSGSGNPFAEDELARNGVTAKVNRVTEGDNSTDIQSIDIDLFVPTKGFLQSPEVKNIANKAFYGQKRANEITDTVDEFQSDNDD